MDQRKIRNIVIGFAIGFSAITLLGFASGSDPHVAVSSDGKYVYVVDDNYLFRSEDFGNTFNKVDKKNF